jgi:REP element-mobilizing transposase RayT
VYYVVLRSNPGRHIFGEAADYGEFERLLAVALERCRANVHAFCWTNNAIHLAVEISDVSVGRLVQRLTSQYARRMHKSKGGSGHLFQQRYQAILIEPEVYLLRLIRHIHYVPVREALTTQLDDYGLSSHSAYLGVTRVPWLTRRLAIRMLTRSGRPADAAYRDLINKPADPRDTERFERGSRRDPRVLGEVNLALTVPNRSRERENADSLDRIIDAVVQRLGVERSALLSKSRQRQLALARALVTWHAIERGIATLAEVGRKLQRDPSTLFVAVERYRALRPELFDGLSLDDGTPPPPPVTPAR